MNNNVGNAAQDVDHNLRSTFNGLVTWERLLIVIIVIAAIFIILKLVDKFIERQLKQSKVRELGSYNRIVTVAQLMRRIIKIVLLFIGITIIMGVFNISVAPILATLGVFSLAIGVGAQDLVKDVINGFFIIFEDQYAVGDIVEIEDITGKVEYLGLRVTKIRDYNKILHIIPNSHINIVSNMQRVPIRTVIDFHIDNSEDPARVEEVVKKGVAKYADSKDMVEGPVFWGVTENAAHYYKMTLVYYTEQGNQWDLEYAIRAEILKVLQKEGIKTPRLKNQLWRENA